LRALGKIAARLSRSEKRRRMLAFMRVYDSLARNMLLQKYTDAMDCSGRATPREASKIAKRAALQSHMRAESTDAQ
jgi:hypothetical protein